MTYESLAPGPPAFHLAVPVGWMNDPNGLVFDGGVYHACYQHHPDRDVWGPMHWRHATSTDLATWTDHGIALAPDEHGTCYSGTAVVDRTNSAGFGRDAMVAVFTQFLGDAQSQSLAHSEDGGRTWSMHDANPVLARPDRRDFRDPRVWWDAERRRWSMVLAAGDHLEFFTSPDLHTWTETSSFRLAAFGDGSEVEGVYECPELIRSGDDWILIVSLAQGVPPTDSFAVSCRGEFDGNGFRALAAPERFDFGPDCYAVQAFTDAPDAQPIVMAWMNNWGYANLHPSRGRRGMMTLPRRIEVLGDGSSRVRQRPVLDALGRDAAGSTATPRPGEGVLAVGPDGRLWVESEHGIVADMTVHPSEVVVHRHRPGRSDDGRDLGARLRLPRNDPGRDVVTVIDHGSLEVFVDDGATVASFLVFPGVTWSVRAEGSASLFLLTPPARRTAAAHTRG